MPFLYYVQNVHDEVGVRVSSEWPPIGGEDNVVIFRCAITPAEAELPLSELMRKYPLGTDKG